MMKVLNAVKWVLGLLLPMFARARDVRSISPALRWVLHFVLLAIVLVLVTVVWNLANWDRLVSGSNVFVKKTMPALLLLALYTLCWIGWWIYQILMEPPPSSQFPDIDEAWDDALRALDAAGIDLTEVPLYLILGRPEASEEGLFDAAGLVLKVNYVPRSQHAPLHVYANRDGVYVTCAGASALGHQAALLAGEAHLPDAGRISASRLAIYDDEDFKTGSFTEETFGGQTNDPREIDKWIKVKEIINRARSQGRGPTELTDDERRELDRLDEREKESATATRKPILTYYPAELERFRARFQHFCRLIVRDRRPFCPVNGLMLLIPFTATDSDELSTEIAKCVQDDLAIARNELRVNCPILTVMSDMEKVRGYPELTTRLPRQALAQRVGQRFPFAPEVTPDELPAQIEGAVRHIGDSFFPNLVGTLWRIEENAMEEDKVTRDNVQLFRFLSEIRERQRKLARINAKSLGRDLGSEPLMFGGCYLAGTGRGDGYGPAFVRGIFQRLAKGQEDVSWTQAALADDTACERWTGLGYVGVAIAAAAIVIGSAFIVMDVINRSPSQEPTADVTK